MGRINRARTGGGGPGKTALGTGVRVKKNHPLIEASGEIDELNCVLGMLGCELRGRNQALVRSLQNDLFDLGADLSVPIGSERKKIRPLRLTARHRQRLERELKGIPFKPAGGFVLPGGSETVARAHLARAVCRRAERRAWALAELGGINLEIPRYLNRLSALLFAMCRALEVRRQTVYWRPGASLLKK